MARIVVVDDELDIRLLVEKLLTREGHTVTLLADGESALEEVPRDKPDLVILDLNLPDVDGFEVCRRLKAAPATRDIPVIMITAAFADLEHSREGLEAGADEYIAKPFANDILVYNVKHLLGGELGTPFERMD
jgi:DNA-binding response OmpR family regulator